MNKDNLILLALGSNLNFEGKKPEQILRGAIEDICKIGGKLCSQSKIYRSKSWPKGSDNPDYYNMIIAVDGENIISAAQYLGALHQIENEYGRVRNRQNRWSSRTLDIDLIDFKGEIIEIRDGENSLICPHPRAFERVFVLMPLCEIYPDYIHPLTLKRADEALAHLVEYEDKDICFPVIGT